MADASRGTLRLLVLGSVLLFTLEGCMPGGGAAAGNASSGASASSASAALQPNALRKPTPLTVSCALNAASTFATLSSFASSGCTSIQTPANVHLAFSAAAGTKLVIPSSVTVTFGDNSSWMINGDLEIVIAGTYQVPAVRRQFFYGTGSLATIDTYSSLGCPVVSRVAYPEWFGAVVNDGFDDSVAINQALQFGNDVELAAGTYDLANRVFLIRGSAVKPLLGGQRQVLGGQLLNGVSLQGTILNQMPTANLVHTPNGVDGSHPEYQPLFGALMAQDFIVGISSDCGRVSNLTIDGSRLPSDMRQLSNFGNSDLPIVSGIQISSILGFLAPPYAPVIDPPVKNVTVQNVRISRPASSCINIQSSRGVDGVLLDSISCTARTERPNTSGMTIEAYGYAYNDNPYKNITLQNSQFTGGRSVFYLAGTENLLFNNVIAQGEQGTVMNTLVYTGDMDFPLTATFRNSQFLLMSPPASSGDLMYDQAAQAVFTISGRGYANTYVGMPFMQPVNTSLTIENSLLQSATYSAANPNARLIPLVRDLVGLSNVVQVKSSTFRGGSYAIMGKNVYDSSTFGGVAYIPDQPVRDLTPSEIDAYKLSHSSFMFSLCNFYDQAFSAIDTEYANLQVFDSYFYNIGRSPAALDYPIIDLGVKSPYGPTLANSLANNGYSGVYATAFLRMPSNLPLTYTANAAFATSESRPANMMDSIRLR